ncbi:MAG: inositol monophosphatase family protein [Acidimicrobiia bacterium]
MSEELLDFNSIKKYEKQFLDIATSIRNKINNLELKKRKIRTIDVSNQYAIDLVADNTIDEYLIDFPGYVISEEREINKNEIENNELIVVIDPIDGSSNASRGIGYWSFSAALVYRGKVQLGVVVDQVQGWRYTANEYENPKLKITDNYEIDLLNDVDINNSFGTKANNYSSSIICFNSHDGPEVSFRHLRNYGSSALSICHVASGSIDAYIDGEDIMLKPWDLLAGEYISKKSSCFISRRDSQGLFAATGVLISKNVDLYNELKKIFVYFP